LPPENKVEHPRIQEATESESQMEKIRKTKINWKAIGKLTSNEFQTGIINQAFTSSKSKLTIKSTQKNELIKGKGH